MRVAYVTARFPFEPVEQFFEPEVRALARYGDVFVIPTRPRGNVSHYDLGATKALCLSFADRGVRRAAWREFARDPVAAVRAFAHVTLGPNAPRARVVNAYSFGTALALADRVRSLHIDHIHAQWLTSPATVAYVASQLTGVPFSMSAHQHDIFAANLLAPKVKRARFVRVISDRNRAHLERHLPPGLRQRCSTVHLGVDVPGQAAQVSRRIPRILCAARMCVWKGHRDLLAALALLRDRGVAFECDLAGDGELRREVSAAIARHGLGDRVRMLGALPHAELLSRIAAGDYDLFALASTERAGEHEGIPVAAIEALAAGVPVVATRTGSLGELVDAESGILVPQRNPQLFAAALARLLEDPALRRRLGRAGRQRVLSEFTVEATTERLAGLIGLSAVAGAQASSPMGPWPQARGNVGAFEVEQEAVS